LWYWLGLDSTTVNYMVVGLQHVGMEAKNNLRQLDSDEVDFHICNKRGCQNSYTPFVANTGDRYCLTHGTK